MIRLNGGIYVAYLNGYTIKLNYLLHDRVHVYINNQYSGEASFNQIKRKINRLEKEMDPYHLKQRHSLQ